MYEPKEDSEMLVAAVVKYSRGKVLDMGTGKGMQALAAANCDNVKEVLAVDVDGESIAYCHKNVDHDKITFQVSNLFSTVKGKFDTILFNPPYLPQDKGIKDLALYGGEKGYELIKKFFDEVGKYLRKGGKILMVFSSFTDKGKVDAIIHSNGLNIKLLGRRHIFFEDLYVYLVKKK